MDSTEAFDAVVVGAGFYGLSLAEHLARRGMTVALLEETETPMGRASYNNQARIHQGYHYPRSMLTAVRSRQSFTRFSAEYRDCVFDQFRKVYAIARDNSKVGARQFEGLMKQIGAPICPLDAKTARLFDPRMVEATFSCIEYAFDAARLSKIAVGRCVASGAQLFLGTRVTSVNPSPGGALVNSQSSSGGRAFSAKFVINATYARLRWTVGSAEDVPPLRHELAEMCLISPPPDLEGIGITIMCGDFFSMMPFPDRKIYTLSHVRYTPHMTWMDKGRCAIDPYAVLRDYPRRSHFPHMKRDAARYVPALQGMIYRDSLWEVKTILPRSDGDDSRPILFHRSPRTPRLVSVLGGKIDNVYDAMKQLDQLLDS